MEDDNNDGPFTVWQMFNAPTVVLFDNLERAADGFERLLTSILKLTGDFSEVLVPRPGTSKHPERYFYSFNTWLMGRLFYLWSVKELEKIHIQSKDAQLKILSILCVNNASFYKKIHTEYVDILFKLIEYYKHAQSQNDSSELELRNFIPDEIVIPNAQLNLEQIFVKVNDKGTCINLINITLQFLSESIPLDSIAVDKNKADYQKIFTHVLYVLETFGFELKLSSLKFFVDLMTHYNDVAIDNFHQVYPDVTMEFLSHCEALLNSIDIFHKKGEINIASLNTFCKLFDDLLLHEVLYDEYEAVIKSICTTILSHREIQVDQKLIGKCLSICKDIEFSSTLFEIEDSTGNDSVSDYYVNKILQFARSKAKDDSRIRFMDNWYYSQMLAEMNTIKINKDKDIAYKSLKRVSKAIDVLQVVCVKGKRLEMKCFKMLIEKHVAVSIWTNLLTAINNKHTMKNMEINIIFDITVATVLLTENLSSNNTATILQILCFQTNQNFNEHNLDGQFYSDKVKFTILKYILMIKILLQIQTSDNWNALINYLVNNLFRQRTEFVYKEMIKLSPLLLLNRVYTASKLIAELFMPAFLIKDHEIQLEITKTLPLITCLSLGNYSVGISLSTENYRHSLFRNETLNICLVCSNCHPEVKLSQQLVLKSENNMPSSENMTVTNGLRNIISKFANWKQYTDLTNTEYWSLISTLCKHFYVFGYGFSGEILSVDNSHHIITALQPYLDNQDDTNTEWHLHKEAALNMVVNLLVKATRQSLENNDYNQQSQTLNLIKGLGSHSNENVVLPATKLLIYFIMHPQCTLGHKAVVYLKHVCETHKYTPNQVYHRYKKDYCKLFVECSLYNGKDFAVALWKVVRAFGFVGYRDFISKDVHHFLPYLIPYAVTIPEVPAMIEELALMAQCSVQDFLTERFPHIYVHIYLYVPEDVGKQCYEILRNLTKTLILSLVKKHFRVILTEFLLEYCCYPKKVLSACRYLACHDPDVSSGNLSESAVMNTSQIADFLNPKFLGVLAYFDYKLVNSKVALSVKRKALKSFPDIMQLMGVKYLTPLRYKVLAMLRSALPLAKEFPKILAEAWGAFICNIDSMSLGPLLSNLAISLLQQFEYAPQEINKIFHYLVLNNENLLSTHISDLFFLEDSKISQNVKTVIKRHVRKTRPEGFLEKVKWYLQHLNQDIPIVKANAFNHLDELLKKNRTELHKAIFGGKNIDPIIVDLIDALLIGCKEPVPEVSAASGECLGQLGAIEVGHLPRQYVQPDSSPFAFSIGDNSFVATALLELGRAFQYEKDTMNMDSYSLTIQEILKIFDISPTGSKKDVWDSFPEHMHQIMYPLLSSRYILAYPPQPKKQHPLFGTQYATTFLDWIHNWTGQLIPLIESQSIRELLRTVHPSMRRDIRTLFLFLPYVLLHALMDNKNAEFIFEEMLAVVGLENFENENVVTERSKSKMLQHVRMIPNLHSVQNEEGNQSKCSKTIYTLLDFLNKWALEWCNSKQRPMENEGYTAIVSFLNKFDKLTIARGNFLCGELERALQYLEWYMVEDKGRLQEQLSFLAEIYALLDEPDSVAGILCLKRSEPPLKELIMTQVVTGRLQDAALCYERLAQEGQLDRHSLKGMIECYLGLDQPFTAYRLLSEHDSEDEMTELSAEPLWRLGKFEQLEELIKNPVVNNRENWGLLMGKILLSFRHQDHEQFEISCKDANSKLLAQMDRESKGENALRSGYQSVLGLHIVTEARHTEEFLKRLKRLNDGGDDSINTINQLLEEWRRRLSVVQSDVRTIESLLRFRRILLQQTQELLESTHPLTANRLKACIGDLWLQSAKHARKAGIFQQSYMYVLNAEEYRPEELFIEKAKIYWARGQHEHAFTTIRRGLDDAFPDIEELTDAQRKICAKAKLLIANYNDETTKVDVDVNLGYYKESIEVFKEWEKSYVCMGSYYEKVSNSETVTDTSIKWTRKIRALDCYGKALQYGHKYLYQSMPRMLSIWLDVVVTSQDTTAHSILAKMTAIIKLYSERLPLYLYLTAFSQIVSRICHPVKEVYLQLKAIIVRLILAYPQHTLWMMMCVIKSGYPTRMKRCADVFADPRLKEPPMLKLVNDFTKLAMKLIELCNKPIIVEDGTEVTVSELVRTLPRLLADDNFSHIMMPFQEFCKIVLPSKAARQECLDFNIPVDPPVYIAGVEDHITILPSLQKPRKVTLKGSNGKSYIIMLKPRDDLRKDYRLMEFNGVLNRFLQDAPETRRRRLYIRTYSVLPLNEECGLIEWVPNLVGLRPILMQIYKQRGVFTTNRELKEMMCLNTDPVEKKRRMYMHRLLPRHPPVLQDWFRRVFSDPYGWYQARSAYIRTTAVMSMVGYILGLGDRHGENVSFDSTNGDTVHVDFNCLFNKGESFEWPERVPFRLTHNMEAAMGPLKHEGMFRKSCEAVMRALRAQTAALMSVIDPFLYDPLVSWGRARHIDTGERTNEQALVHLIRIRQRLSGMVKTKNDQLSLPLSPEGQVEHLIAEATSITNLCQMYIGWGPFL